MLWFICCSLPISDAKFNWIFAYWFVCLHQALVGLINVNWIENLKLDPFNIRKLRCFETQTTPTHTHLHMIHKEQSHSEDQSFWEPSTVQRCVHNSMVFVVNHIAFCCSIEWSNRQRGAPVWIWWPQKNTLTNKCQRAQSQSQPSTYWQWEYLLMIIDGI